MQPVVSPSNYFLSNQEASETPSITFLKTLAAQNNKHDYLLEIPKVPAKSWPATPALPFCSRVWTPWPTMSHICSSSAESWRPASVLAVSDWPGPGSSDLTCHSEQCSPETVCGDRRRVVSTDSNSLRPNKLLLQISSGQETISVIGIYPKILELENSTSIKHKLSPEKAGVASP